MATVLCNQHYYGNSAVNTASLYTDMTVVPLLCAVRPMSCLSVDSVRPRRTSVWLSLQSSPGNTSQLLLGQDPSSVECF